MEEEYIDINNIPEFDDFDYENEEVQSVKSEIDFDIYI